MVYGRVAGLYKAIFWPDHCTELANNVLKIGALTVFEFFYCNYPYRCLDLSRSRITVICVTFYCLLQFMYLVHSSHFSLRSGLHTCSISFLWLESICVVLTFHDQRLQRAVEFDLAQSIGRVLLLLSQTRSCNLESALWLMGRHYLNHKTTPSSLILFVSALKRFLESVYIFTKTMRPTIYLQSQEIRNAVF